MQLCMIQKRTFHSLFSNNSMHHRLGIFTCLKILTSQVYVLLSLSNIVLIEIGLTCYWVYPNTLFGYFHLFEHLKQNSYGQVYTLLLLLSHALFGYLPLFKHLKKFDKVKCTLL